MNNFKDNVAVITGAASGIGKAIAEKCLEHEMTIVLADINKEKLEEVANYLKKDTRSQILSVTTNVADENDIYQLTEKTISEFGKINFLFNNAGIAGALGPIWEQSSSSIKNVMCTNILGTIYGIKAIVPIMLKQNDQCYIVNTSAGAGLLTGKGLSAYKASKHAITAISEVLYADLKQINSNIHVSLLIPHWVNTQMPHSIDESDLDTINVHLEHLQKFGMCASDVAEIVFSGINKKQFYIFTNPDEHLPKIKKRMEAILATDYPG
ncbi:MAG: 3-oxoacyl-ACP reductase [Burkholderiales bacterium]|jgi:NADP-dependent 3-hydroxy acid dehydrogenase YdfG|nr:3-oxoacyl-ACP reductase [Burkholderiales bacterium]